MKIKCSVFYLFFACLAGAVLCISQASATIFASGDSTPAYYAGDNDNNVFFENILDGGTSVVVHELSNSSIGGNLDNFYNSLAGVSSIHYQSSTTITASLLADVDFFVTGLHDGGLDATESGVLSAYLAGGGSILFMGEYTYL